MFEKPNEWDLKKMEIYRELKAGGEINDLDFLKEYMCEDFYEWVSGVVVSKLEEDLWGYGFNDLQIYGIEEEFKKDAKLIGEAILNRVGRESEILHIVKKYNKIIKYITINGFIYFGEVPYYVDEFLGELGYRGNKKEKKDFYSMIKDMRAIHSKYGSDCIGVLSVVNLEALGL